MTARRLAGDITEDSVYITWHGNRIGTLTRRMNDACEEEYLFRIDWNKWDELGIDEDIAGINMELRLDEYVRDHVPSFLTDYLPPRRNDTPELLKRLGLEHYDIWDIMVATGRNCRDSFRVEPVE